MAAFLADYVEENFSSVVAVVAQNPHLLVSVFFGHHCCFNFLVYSLPGSRHVHDRLGTYWAAVPFTLYQLMVAFRMHGVSTFHDCYIFERVEQILITYRAVMSHGILHAEVIVE